MGKEKAGMVRVRVFFDDHLVLNNPQLSDGKGRYWLLLKPSIGTFADLASHIRKKFALSHRLVLCIGDFVLPPFESVCIITGEDIIGVKQKNVKLEDVYKSCDSQDLVKRSRIAGENNLSLTNHVNAVHKSLGMSQGNLNNESAPHDDSLSLSILVPKKKREHLLEHPSSMKQLEEISKGFESELHTLSDVTKECDQLSCVTSQRDQNKFTKTTFKGRNYNDCDSSGLDRKPEEHSPDKNAKTAEHKINFSSIFPLTRSPMKGDILAYRYVEPSSTAYPELSSPQVGKVSAFDHESSVIVLVRASEFEVFSEYDPLTNVSLERASYPYKADGLLEIKLSALIDIRLVKAHDSTELAFLPEGTFNRSNANWEVASKRSNSNLSESQYTANKLNGWDSWSLNNSTNTRSWSCTEPSFLFPRGRENGVKYSANETRASTGISGATPAEVLFWETILSKVPNGKAGKCSAPGKY